MKILVPIDFSSSSKVAAVYALKFGNFVKSEVVFLNVIDIRYPPHIRITLKTEQIKKVKKETVVNELLEFIDTLKNELKNCPEIKYATVEGYPSSSIISDFAEYNGFDLIIMGTKGASGTKKIIMGSNAAAVINLSKVPVITVPEHTRYKTPKNIVYACDLRSADTELSKIIPIASLFSSNIHVLHVDLANNEDFNPKELKRQLVKDHNYKKLHVEKVNGSDFKEAVNDYIVLHDIDLIAMFPHKSGLFDRFFGNSATREMAFQSKIPLLTFRRDN